MTCSWRCTGWGPARHGSSRPSSAATGTCSRTSGCRCRPRPTTPSGSSAPCSRWRPGSRGRTSSPARHMRSAAGATTVSSARPRKPEPPQAGLVLVRAPLAKEALELLGDVVGRWDLLARLELALLRRLELADKLLDLRVRGYRAVDLLVEARGGVLELRSLYGDASQALQAP